MLLIGVGLGPKFRFGCEFWGHPHWELNAQGLQTKQKGRTASHGLAVRHACQLFLQTVLKCSLLGKEPLILTALAGIQACSKKTLAVYLFLTAPPLKPSEW